jgi:transposase InsO family protein
MADHLKADLCIDALVMALQRCRPGKGLIHHSDRGVQGGFKWSSQHLQGGSCDVGSETPFGSIRSAAIFLTRPPAGSGAR